MGGVIGVKTFVNRSSQTAWGLIDLLQFRAKNVSRNSIAIANGRGDALSFCRLMDSEPWVITAPILSCPCCTVRCTELLRRFTIVVVSDNKNFFEPIVYKSFSVSRRSLQILNLCRSPSSWGKRLKV